MRGNRAIEGLNLELVRLQRYNKHHDTRQRCRIAVIQVAGSSKSVFRNRQRRNRTSFALLKNHRRTIRQVTNLGALRVNHR